MKNTVLFLGNDLNNLNNEQSWSQLLQGLINECELQKKQVNTIGKPFPLLYEEIFLRRKNKKILERNLKLKIAEDLFALKTNEFHERIVEANLSHIITSNYDYTLESLIDPSFDLIKNNGLIKEAKYSVFRKIHLGSTHYWHMHGECKIPNSICLGYEHYAGQLQMMRNYVISGTNYLKDNPVTLNRRIGKLGFVNTRPLSWIDLFFQKDIHLVGISLDTSEIDLWWLLTFRARLKDQFPKKINNKIIYYYPQEYESTIKTKLELLQAKGISLKGIKASHRSKYYSKVFDLMKLPK